MTYPEIRPTAKAMLLSYSDMHRTFRAEGDNADPLLIADRLLSSGCLLIGFARRVKLHHAREIPDGLTDEVTDLAERTREAIIGAKEETIVVLGDSRSGNRRVILPRDSSVLSEILTPPVSQMGLPARTPDERDGVFDRLHAWYFPQSA